MGADAFSFLLRILGKVAFCFNYTCTDSAFFIRPMSFEEEAHTEGDTLDTILLWTSTDCVFRD